MPSGITSWPDIQDTTLCAPHFDWSLPTGAYHLMGICVFCRYTVLLVPGTLGPKLGTTTSMSLGRIAVKMAELLMSSAIPSEGSMPTSWPALRNGLLSESTRVSIRRRTPAHGQIRFADTLQRVFPTA